MSLQNFKYLNSIFLLALIYKSWPGHYIGLVEKKKQIDMATVGYVLIYFLFFIFNFEAFVHIIRV